MSDYQSENAGGIYPRFDPQTGEPLPSPATNSAQTTSGIPTASSSGAPAQTTSGAPAAPASPAPHTTGNAQSAHHGPYVSQSAPAAQAPLNTAYAPAKQGGGKTFLMGFLGAAVACVLAIAIMFGTGLVGGIAKSSSSGSTSLGSSSNTSITVEGEDAELAEVIAEKTTPSVCCIYVYSKQNSYSLYGFGTNTNSNELTQSSLGSGVIVTADGYVVTNYHVIEGADALKVSANGTEYDATIVGTDESSDLAVIKLTGASGLTPIELGDSDALTTGEWVMSIGSPFGLESSVATGIVSATSRSQIMSASSSGSSSSSAAIYVNLIQTDAAINPGNSGGALVDAEGKLIGINTLITSYSGNYSGVGFAIPVNYAMEIANTIIAGETPSHAQLGVTLVSVTSSLAQRYNLHASSGAYISSVSTDSAADKAGLQVGDIVTKFGDTTISSASDLMIAIRLHDPGDSVTVTYNRGGKEQTATVELGSDTSTASTASSIQRNSSSSEA